MTSLVMEIVEVDAMARSDERDAGASASSSEQSEASRKRDTVSDEAFIDRRALLPANETVEQKPFGGVKPCPTKGCGGEMR